MSLQILSETQKHKYCQDALAIEKAAGIMFLSLGEYLYNIREKRLYEPFWASWNEFCMEFKDLSQGSISKLIIVHEVFVLGFGFSPTDLAKAGGWTKLYALKDLAKTKTEAQTLIEASERLSRSDLNKLLIETRTGVDMAKCGHSETYIIEICKHCGERWEVHASTGAKIELPKVIEDTSKPLPK